MSFPSAFSIGLSVNHAVNGGELELLQNNDPELLGPYAASPTMEATSDYAQIHAPNEFWFHVACQWHQLQSQHHLLLSKSQTEPETGLGGHSIIQSFQVQTEPNGTGGNSTIQSSQAHDDRRTDPKLGGTTCEPCNRSFKRKQEYKRHMRDVHTDRDKKPRCPFCTFKWTRPNKIKDHILTTHKECLAPDILHEISSDRLCGQRLVQYLDRLSQDISRKAAFESISCYNPLGVSV